MNEDTPTTPPAPDTNSLITPDTNPPPTTSTPSPSSDFSPTPNSQPNMVSPSAPSTPFSSSEPSSSLGTEPGTPPTPSPSPAKLSTFNMPPPEPAESAASTADTPKASLFESPTEEASVLDTPAVIPASPPVHSLSKSVLIISVLVAVVAGFGAGYGTAWMSTKNKPAAKTTTSTMASDVALKVPEGATVIAECAMGLGKQYVLPKNIPLGPVYNVYNGKVTGIEYMLGQQDLAQGKSFTNLPLNGVKYDHIDIGLLPMGHAGYAIPHYLVDVMTISSAEAAKITCM